MNLEEKLDYLLKEEQKWRKKAMKAAKPYLKKAHQIHLQWSKLYNKHMHLEWVKMGLRKNF